MSQWAIHPNGFFYSVGDIAYSMSISTASKYFVSISLLMSCWDVAASIVVEETNTVLLQGTPTLGAVSCKAIT